MLTFLSTMGLVLTAITLPLVLELALVTSLMLLLPRRKARRHTVAPSLTAVVPAHNEEASIEICVESLLRSAQGATKVLVVAHNCSDATAERAAQAGAEVLIYNEDTGKTKGHALRQGFRHALSQGATAVLVVDADSVVSENLIPEVLRVLGEGAAAVQCRYEMSSADQSPRSRLIALAFRAFTFVRPAGRERLGLSAGISGNGFALTSQLLEKVPYEAFSIVEDLEYHIELVMAGERVRFVEDAVVSSNLPTSTGGETSQQSRWQGGRFYVARKRLLPIVRAILTGKLRLIEPLLDLSGLPLAFGVVMLVAEALLPLHWARTYALTSLAVVAIHVLTAAWAGPDFLSSLSLLATAPFYILWKLRLLPKLLKASNSQAAWISTERGMPAQSSQFGRKNA
jgi:cellulose synthase/poly-beta-1,6-N-acetylglucosamine synthase-like glycosyltransferase